MRLILLSGSCVALAIALPLHAGAKPKKGKSGQLITKTATELINDDQYDDGSAEATCPKGSHLISGGFQVTPQNPTTTDQIDFLTAESLPTSARSWKVYGLQPGSGGSRVKLVVYAYCKRSGPTPTVVEVSKSLNPGAPDHADAKCPKGSKATAGGFRAGIDAPGDAFLLANESRRFSARVWRTGATNPSGNPAELKSYALCTKKVKKTSTRSATQSGPSSGGNAYTVAKAGKCPKKGGALAGGFAVELDGPSEWIAIQQSRRLGRFWQTGVRGDEGGPSTSTTSEAYCP
ncbi:MAG: hypothetical protein EXQ70_09745 [Solirubrobacterales bacterium]|nr:hypothetical protein [Solirubrobacterales bacterium]